MTTISMVGPRDTSERCFCRHVLLDLAQGSGRYLPSSGRGFRFSSPASFIVTTEEILTEFLTFFGGKGPFLSRKAVAITRGILADGSIRVLPQTHVTFSAGFELYASRPDKGYSLTDCISMRREGINDALTDDRHFEQEGFRALFRDSYL
jgi:predicted nucleic acid-binding protein